MRSMRIAGFAAFAVLLAACNPAPDGEQAITGTATPEAAAPDDAALHALLVAHADDLVPSDWQTGEPVSETSLTYWMLPELDVEADRSAECSPVADTPDLHDCTLSFVSRPEQDEDEPVTALFRFTVRESADGGLTLDSPAVRWAVIG